MLDNTSYQRYRMVEAEALRLGITFLFYPIITEFESD